MPIALRTDFDAVMVRAAARKSKDGAQARRLLALAAIYEGSSRTEAARLGDVTVQIVRDWVVKFNASGPDGLIDRKAPGKQPLLNATHRAALVDAIERGPIPAAHGVVRWRIIDLAQMLWDDFSVSISRPTLSRELRALGYRKLSARPKHHAQDPEAIEAFRKGALPPSWTRSKLRARVAHRKRFGSRTRPGSGRRTRSRDDGPGAGRGPRHRTINAANRPISSAQSAHRKAKRPALSCRSAIPTR